MPTDLLEWNTQQEIILKKWAEIASCYQWMHEKSYRIYKEKNIHFALPVIVLSTITGTANFAQNSFPERYKHLLVMGIGSLNLIAGLITTISQFLRINELQEGYRVAEVGFSKLNRNIEVVLDLPIKYRNVSGETFLESCRQEYDRLIEQSPMIPKNIVLVFHKKFKKNKISKPNLITIAPLEIYKEEKSMEPETTEEEKLHLTTMRNLRFLKEQMSCIDVTDDTVLKNETKSQEIYSDSLIDIKQIVLKNESKSEEICSDSSIDINGIKTTNSSSNNFSDDNNSNISDEENNI